jgi:hypothetical protein
MAAKKTKETTDTSNKGDICQLFFTGGKKQVRKLLTEALRKERNRQQLTTEELDEKCYVREDGLPSCADVETDPSIMTYKVFCRTACALGLRVDNVLKINLSPSKVKRVLKIMDENNAGLAAALGGKKVKYVADEEVAPIYARFKILSEL